MQRLILLAAAVATIPLAAAFAQMPAPLTPEQVVAARQSAYLLSAGSMAGIKGAIDGGGDLKAIVFPARTLSRWARTLPTMFPEGSNVPPTHARPEVWTNRADFEAKAEAYAAAAARLAELAPGGDRAAVTAQFDALRNACQACHDVYREAQ